ncbi:MAG TPA: STAS domain-containing protein [Usitatibacter sp.]|jgi:anti-anti-sigma factor|nr:STAS domain-containing protein [Usitatibacter sp.]
MNVSSRRYANAALVQVSGRLDQDTCEAFRGQLMGFVDQAAHDGGAIVLDLSQLEYVSSAGLRCFMLASRQAKAQHGRIFVAALQPMVREIFEISHFNLVFQVFPTLREAMAAVSSEAALAFEKG